MCPWMWVVVCVVGSVCAVRCARASRAFLISVCVDFRIGSSIRSFRSHHIIISEVGTRNPPVKPNGIHGSPSESKKNRELLILLQLHCAGCVPREPESSIDPERLSRPTQTAKVCLSALLLCGCSVLFLVLVVVFYLWLWCGWIGPGLMFLVDRNNNHM